MFELGVDLLARHVAGTLPAIAQFPHAFTHSLGADAYLELLLDRFDKLATSPRALFLKFLHNQLAHRLGQLLGLIRRRCVG